LEKNFKEKEKRLQERNERFEERLLKIIRAFVSELGIE